jgi:hypothetical protein
MGSAQQTAGMTAPAGRYATSVAYSYETTGPGTATTLGNGLVETVRNNWRGHPTQMSLGALWTLVNHYGTTSNNGNVLKQTLAAPGMQTLTTVYGYDWGNRLEKAAEYTSDHTAPACPDGTSVWCQQYNHGPADCTRCQREPDLCRIDQPPRR